MKTELLSVLASCLLTGALALSGCSSDDQADGSNGSSGSSGASSSSGGPDAGYPAADGGCPAADGGCPAADGGCPAADGGCPAADGGCPATAGDDQTPPTGAAADIDAWLAGGAYEDWSCEEAPHAARSPSPHGINRICSNTKLSESTAGDYPIGSAGVKELYDSTGTNIIGYATYLKVSASNDGAGWYWFERAEGLGLVANSLGDQGNAKSVCTSCHAGAPRDFVFTQVQ